MEEKTKDLLAKAAQELYEFVDGDDCDHSVGICYCDVYQLIDDIKQHLHDNPSTDGIELIDGKPKPLVLKGYI